jgi:predicted transcriptional regulator of viral defense system
MPSHPEPGRETRAYETFLSQASVDEAIAALAQRQHAVMGLDQLVGLGLGPSGVRLRRKASRLHRIHRTVYSLVPRALLTREGHWMAAVLACGPGAVLSHRNAAALHGLRPTQRTKIDVTVPRRSARKHRGIDVHRSTTLTPADVTVANGIPCTTPARTLLDLAEVIARRPLERAFDQAEILDLFDLYAIEDQLARNSTRPAARRVKQLLEEHYIGSTPTQSELEEAFLALCRRLRLPEPKVSRWIDLHDGEPMIWADFVWFEQRVIVETDGDKFHGTHQARERDPRRDQRAIVAGWMPVRTTWRQVMRRPRELEPTLLALVERTDSRAAGDCPVPLRPGTPRDGESTSFDRQAVPFP